MTRVLAIDPGFGRCGAAVLEKKDGKDTLVYSMCIETESTLPFPSRLSAVTKECETLIQKFSPGAFAIEKLFFSKNQKTAMRVAEVRGALIECAARYNIPVFEYSPAEIKVAAAGFGAADKTQVKNMLRMLVHIQKEISFDDEYDAIAVGVTHLAHGRSA